ncbi:MAG: tripartite tricarboxylate transporter substrate binding protein [Acetobacteraceae bacterium]|nr:tripartite tricarboxylate transporter substrate binding protein [Acetobacteraceae bacterium]
MSFGRRPLLAAATAAQMPLAAPAVLAQATTRWRPDRPLRLIVPFPPGGGADIFGRVFADALGTQLGQPVVVENRAGVGGVTGVDVAAKAAPDGYTLGFTTAGVLAIAPAMPMRMPFDPARDLAHLTLVVRVPEVLVVHPGTGFTTLGELIAAAKARPDALQYGSSGVGSITHLACALLAKEAGFEAVHVPFRGIAPAVTETIAGRVHFVVADVPVLSGHIAAGVLRPLTVTTAQRVASLPEVPTTAELGLPRVNSDNWYGLAVPAATPAPVQEALHAAAVEALAAPTLAREFARGAGIPSPMPRAEYLAYIRAEREKWGPVVRASGATSF